MRAYLYMTKIKLLLALNYRFEFFINFLIQIVLLFTLTFFWQAAYKGIDTVASVNQQQMLTYAMLSVVMTNLISTSVESNIHNKVRKGNVAVDYIKPINVFLLYFFEDIGNMVTSLIQRAIPLVVFSSLFIQPPLPVSLAAFCLFMVSFCLSFLILWFVAAIFGLFYFKAVEMGPIGYIKDWFIRILSGSFIPIWFFPQWVQSTLQFLPFIYTYQLPLSIYIGRTGPQEALKGLLMQCLWIAVFYFLFTRLKKHIENNLFVQGG